MGTVTLAPEFFAGELRRYADWRTALCREMLQNSLDAGARRIDVETGDGTLSVTDDGSGMSEATLEQVFFRLGTTTKHTDETIGGNGVARTLICFAQASYEIRTRDLDVRGAGSEYTIERGLPYVDGTRFTISLADGDSDRVADRLDLVLHQSDVQAEVTVNGEPGPRTPTPDRAKRVLRDEQGSAWARVYVDDGGVGQLLVRSRGLTMFQRYLPLNAGRVTVELQKSRARAVLTSNRDQLVEPFSDQLHAFVDDLTRNRRKALRPAAEPLRRQVLGGGFLTADTGLAAELKPEADAPAAAAATSAGYSQPRTRPTTSEPALPTLDIDQAPGLPFDVFLFAEEVDSRVRAQVRQWDPSRWTPGSNRTRRALLLAWKAAVATALQALEELRPDTAGLSWTVGWVFDDDVKASHTRTTGGHVFALRPVDRDTGRIAFRMSDTPEGRTSRRDLLARALHEVAHAVVTDHDEDYASLLTELIATVDPKEADRAMREAAASARR